MSEISIRKDKTLSTGRRGFSLEAYRNANKVEIVGVVPGGDYTLVSGYHIGNFAFRSGIEFESYADTLMSWMNGMGPIGRSFVLNASTNFGLGSVSGAFDTTAKPYVKSSSPIGFDVKIHLPLFTGNETQAADGSNGKNAFITNILYPINSLYSVTFPERGKDAVTNIINEATEAFKAFNEWLFQRGHGDLTLDANGKVVSGTPGAKFFSKVGTTFNGMVDNFTKDLYALGNPVQFNSKFQMDLYIANFCFRQIMIKAIDVDVAPLMYTDGTYSYPPHANVTVSIQTLRKTTTDSMISINNDTPNFVDSIRGTTTGDYLDLNKV